MHDQSNIRLHKQPMQNFTHQPLGYYNPTTDAGIESERSGDISFQGMTDNEAELRKKETHQPLGFYLEAYDSDIEQGRPDSQAPEDNILAQAINTRLSLEGFFNSNFGFSILLVLAGIVFYIKK